MPSTKPRPFSCGDQYIPFIEKLIESLQRSHGLSAVETRRGKRGKGDGDRPSTKPRPFSRGDNVLSTRVDAGSCLQRSHGLSAVETFLRTCPDVGGLDPSTKPRPFSRGDQSGTGSTAGREHTFNEVTAFQPWKRHGTRAKGAFIVPPSTKPRPFSRGNGISGISSSTTTAAFNEATAFQPWKPQVCFLEGEEGKFASTPLIATPKVESRDRPCYPGGDLV